MSAMISPAERHRLILENIPFVHRAASAMAAPGWLRDDLQSAGYEALVRASTRFSPSGGASFSTFAFVPIRGACTDELAQRLGWWKRQTELSDELDPSTTSADSFHTSGAIAPERRVLASEVLAAVDRLPPELRDLVRMHYLNEQDLSSAGRKLGISKTRACVRLSRAIALLRETLDDGSATWPTASPRPKRRRFSKRFKSSFLRKALDPSGNAKKLARELGISPSTAWNWTAAARKGA